MRDQPAKRAQKDKKQGKQASSKSTPRKWDEMNRAQRREMMRKMQTEDLNLEVVHPDAAGIDIGNESHYVAVPPSLDPQPVRCFGCTTAELRKMADWLTQCGIRTVALQSTGVYWIAVYDILEEAGLEVYLVNARDTKNLPGRKTDVQGRKSHSSCRICQRFDSVAKLSECVDHSRSAGSPRLFGYRRAAFFIANASMQKDPDQLAEAMGNRPDGFIVS